MDMCAICVCYSANLANVKQKRDLKPNTNQSREAIHALDALKHHIIHLNDILLNKQTLPVRHLLVSKLQYNRILLLDDINQRSADIYDGISRTTEVYPV